MKISEFSLIESFDSNVQGKLVRATNDSFTTKADIGNRTIVFNASSFKQDEKDIWEIEFTEKTSGNITYGKTGSGNQMQVFSFVIDSLKELISRYSPDQIIFGSHKEDNNRTSLYKRMATKIKLSGYHLADIESDSYTDKFIIVKDES